MQIEYALAAVAAGATSLGIRATNGVVLATEKKLPSILVDESTVQKISLLTPNVGMTYSGMGPDSRVLVRKARKSGQVYYRQLHEQIPVAQLCRETAAVMQEFTREWPHGGRREGRLGDGGHCRARGQRRRRSLPMCCRLDSPAANACVLRHGGGCPAACNRLAWLLGSASRWSDMLAPALQNRAVCGRLGCRC